MSQQIGTPLKRRMIEMRLGGYGRNEICRRLKSFRKSLSPVSVGTVLKEFEDYANENGAKEAGVKHGVSEKIERLFEIADFSRGNNLGLSEMAEGGKIALQLTKLGLSAEETTIFVEKVCKNAKTRSIEGSKLVAQCLELEELSQKYHFGYEELLKKYAKLGTDFPDRESKLEELDAKIQKNEEKNTKLEEKYSIDEKRAQEYDRVKRELFALGLELAHLDKYRNFLLDVKELRFKPEKIVAKLNAIQKIEEHLGHLTTEESELMRKVGEAKKALNATEIELDKRKDLIEEAKELGSLGLSIEELRDFRSTIVNLSAARGIKPKDAFKAFQKDVVANYDSLMGLSSVVKSLEGQETNLKQELDRAKKELDVLNKQNSARSQEIEAYSRLRARGVEDKSILRWDGIIAKTGLTPQVIEAELKEQSSLQGKAKAKEKEITDLESRVSILKASIQTLETKKSEIESSIQVIKTKALSQLDETKTETIAAIVKVKEILERATPALERLSKSIEVGREIGKYEAILPLWKLLYGENALKNELTPMMRLILEKYGVWLSSHQAEDKELRSAVDTVLSRLER